MLIMCKLLFLTVFKLGFFVQNREISGALTHSGYDIATGSGVGYTVGYGMSFMSDQ